jgi:hypothetical protein
VRRLHVFALIVALLLSGCSLAEEIPPPVLTTTQEVKPVASPTEGISSPTAQATIERAGTEPGENPATTSQGVPSLGTIRGRLVNGTTGEPVASGIEVHLIGFDGQALALTESTTTDTVGEFVFDNLEIVPDRIFGAYAEYHGVEYFSEGRHFSDDEAVLDLLVGVYEATSDTSTIHVDRLHLIFDFTVEGLVEVLEVWVLSNQGGQTVAFLEGQEGIEFILPTGYSDLRFYDELTSEGRFRITDRGFYDRGPLRPIEGEEIIFSFMMPFKGSLDFAQLMSFPVSATVILMPVNGPEVDAIGLQDLGVGAVGGTQRRTYGLGPISAGEAIELRLSGKPSAIGSEGTRIERIIGAVLFSAALIVCGLWWYRIRVRDETHEVVVAGIPNDREHLLRAIADLDDRYEAGGIPEDEYRRRRKTLKRRLMDLMRETHD